MIASAAPMWDNSGTMIVQQCQSTARACNTNLEILLETVIEILTLRYMYMLTLPHSIRSARRSGMGG